MSSLEGGSAESGTGFEAPFGTHEIEESFSGGGDGKRWRREARRRCVRFYENVVRVLVEQTSGFESCPK